MPQTAAIGHNQWKPPQIATNSFGPWLLTLGVAQKAEPVWSPASNNAYKCNSGIKVWATHFKDEAGPNLMRVAVWADGSEWEVPGVLFEKPEADGDQAVDDAPVESRAR
eukprot:11418002-Alexandrium_andersonii.AAC.1